MAMLGRWPDDKAGTTPELIQDSLQPLDALLCTVEERDVASRQRTQGELPRRSEMRSGVSGRGRMSEKMVKCVSGVYHRGSER